MRQKKGLPMIELLVALYLLYLATLFFVFPNLLLSDRSTFYRNVAEILHPATWAYVVFVVGMCHAIGLAFNRFQIRVIALVLSGIIFALFAIAFAKSFPNLSFGVYSLISLFCFLSIVQVNRTEL